MRDKVGADPFLAAKFRVAGFYFILVAILVVVNGLVDELYLRPALVSLAQSGADLTPTETYDYVQGYLWYTRLVRLFSLAVILYFITGLALRPLKAATALQRRFIANVSHELKTPLAVMQSATEVALRKHEKLSLDEAASVLSRNLAEMQRLSSIIKFMIELSELDRRRQRFSAPEVRLAEVAEEVTRLVEGAAKRKGIEVTVAVDGATVPGNHTALEQLLLNLVNNAIEYTPSGGRVAISSHVGEGSLELSVADTGSGIAEEDLRHLHEPFYRGKGSVRGGAGLGLAIVSEIARMHGARVRAHNNPDSGATFTVTFPKYSA